MKSFIGTGALTLALLLSGCGDNGQGNKAAGNTNAPLTQIAAPNGDWTQVVSQTPAGGFLIGNPNAPVKLIEFASMTCPHCAEFSETSAPLFDQYVKSGQVSFELRNYVRDPIDMTAALLARCGGPQPYFKLTEQMFEAQNQWLQPFQQLSQADQQRLSSIPAQRQFAELARVGGLIDFVKMRGIPEAKANACLSDQAALQQLVSMTSAANSEFQIPGTPTFVINGKVAENAGTWAALEPQLRAAIG